MYFDIRLPLTTDQLEDHSSEELFPDGRLAENGSHETERDVQQDIGHRPVAAVFKARRGLDCTEQGLDDPPLALQPTVRKRHQVLPYDPQMRVISLTPRL